MFEGGLNRGKRAAQEKCAAKVDLFGGDTGSAWVAQLVERVLGKDEVTGSIPVPGSRDKRLRCGEGPHAGRRRNRASGEWV